MLLPAIAYIRYPKISYIEKRIISLICPSKCPFLKVVLHFKLIFWVSLTLYVRKEAVRSCSFLLHRQSSWILCPLQWTSVFLVSSKFFKPHLHHLTISIYNLMKLYYSQINNGFCVFSNMLGRCWLCGTNRTYVRAVGKWIMPQRDL